MATKGREHEEVYTVLNPRMTAGPKGLGDPDDRFIRKVEEEIIYKRMRERSELLCQAFKDDFDACMKKTPNMTFAWKCRPMIRALRTCQNQWFNRPEFEEEAKEEYLQQRAEYRRTGVSKWSKEIDEKKLKEFELWLKEKKKQERAASAPQHQTG
ncbi:COX assembly mitochondrial protein homolog [Dreissena polymorpha]|uniref:COX assembly mitochondrial protein n=1 Tax=Dreissena polymorpha TaxID=45954 RepID=A0A9D3Z1S9_DREPO|nr:COX assembly mitochondrial protein homolog [Dreissena polymorpha]KAH3709060.1 hypothetical protein DPMN_068520 [Dreissena polymorpha]